MLNRIRAFLDVNWFIFRRLTSHNRFLYAFTGTLTLISAYTWWQDLTTGALLGVVGGAVGFFYEVIKQLIPMFCPPPYRFVVDQGALGMVDNLELTKDYRDSGFNIENVPQRTYEPVVRSRQVDRHLRVAHIEFLQDGNRNARMVESLRSNPINYGNALRCKLDEALSQKRLFVNESKLCLCDDLLLGGRDLKVWHGSYFDSFLTNELVTKVLQSTDGRARQPWIGHQHFPCTWENGNPVLVSIRDSLMGDHIGVSVLAITRDKRLLLWRQAGAAVVNTELLVSTGSGSTDWEDWANAPHKSLQEIIGYAMKRELMEESSLLGRPEMTATETRVIGYFRWIRRGGKPEFVGVARLPIDADAFKPNKIEVEERSEIPVRYPVASLAQLGDTVATLLHDPDLSVPLWVNLLCLQEWMAAQPDEVNRFLKMS